VLKNDDDNNNNYNYNNSNQSLYVIVIVIHASQHDVINWLLFEHWDREVTENIKMT
jgi:hypothetical protein